jgi:hypothetical protein
MTARRAPAWLVAGWRVPAWLVGAGLVPAGLMPGGGMLGHGGLGGRVPRLVSAGLPAGLVWDGRARAGLVPVGSCAAPEPEHGSGRNPLGGQGRVCRENPSIGRLQLPPRACRTTLTGIQAHPGQQVGQEVGHRKIGRQVNLMPAERADHDDSLAQAWTGARLGRAIATRSAAVFARVHADWLGSAVSGPAKVAVGAGFHARPSRAADGHACPVATTATSPRAA